MTNRKDELQLDFEAGFTARSATVGIALTALTCASIGVWAAMPWWAALATGAVPVAGAVFTTIGQRYAGQPWRVAQGLACVTVVWALYVAQVLFSGPSNWAATGWLVATAGFLTLAAVTWWLLDRLDIADEAHHKRILDGDTRLAKYDFDKKVRPICEEWVARIDRALKIKPVPRFYKEWDNGAGFDIVFEMPEGTRTDAFNAGVCRQLAEDARLPLGCSVAVGPYETQGMIIMQVQTKDPASIVVDFPVEDLSPITINGGVPIMPDIVGDPICAELREACVLIVGPPGSGKTTLLDAMIAGLVRCADTLVWGIDVGKRGGAFRNWADPKRLPTGAVRGVDAVAWDMGSALDMIEAAIRIAEDRATGAKLLHVSAAMPQIMIVIDEGAEILSYQGQDLTQKRLKERLMTLMRTTRSAGVRLILTATDGNVAALGSSEVRKYSPVRVALTSTDRDGAAVNKLFGQVRLDARQLRARGAGVIDVGNGPQIGRTWRTDDGLPGRVMAAVSSFRPVLDNAAVRAAGEWWAKRWENGGAYGDQTPVVEVERSNVVTLPKRNDPFAKAFVSTSAMRAEEAREEVEEERTAGRGGFRNPFADM
jgi:energy-coupling factor transporter ATP-binding protein EcfA2